MGIFVDEEIDELINGNHLLEKLENKLSEISVLADKERKVELETSLIFWAGIILSIITFFL